MDVYKSLTLFINCASKPFSFALANKTELICEIWDGIDKSFSENLIFLVKKELHSINKSFKDIGSMTIITGPGPYTSLRLSVATVNTLSQLYSIPINTFNLADCFYNSYIGSSKFCMVVFPGRKGDYIFSIYVAGKEGKQKIVENIIHSEKQFYRFLLNFKHNVLLIGQIPQNKEKDFLNFEYINFQKVEIKCSLLMKNINSKEKIKKRFIEPFFVYNPI